MKNIPLNERIILALDVESPELAKELVRKTESHISFYKVGLQLFMASWFQIVDWLADRGHKVMVDLKFFDIPETVKLAVAQLNNRSVSFATIHGNDPIIRAAVEAKGDLALLAVTVLTSFGQEDMQAMGMTKSIEELVYFRAKRALELGCDGVVCSGLEAPLLREGLGDKLLLVTPGIRPGTNTYDKKDDQQRVATARQAMADGVDYLVVGRPITRAADPVSAILSLQDEIKQGLSA
ncbi:MAG: orotidine-5'-phosphate decarboxylase [Desulfobulbales bacterium]|nr:orotidine-5'-phosphate decarboxylase [Desulfobulbales bacterium]